MKPLDLVGEKFGLLTVEERVPPPKKAMCANYHNQTWWKLRCDCGSKKKVIKSRQALKSGSVRSCGCLPTGPKPMSQPGLNPARAARTVAKIEAVLRDKRQRAAEGLAAAQLTKNWKAKW